MSIHPDILAWSQERPLWQQDALRRLVDKHTLTADDYAELVSICRHEYGLIEPNAVAAVPLSEAHCAKLSKKMVNVTLLDIGQLKHVNNLLPGQTLSFAPAGLTVVYGDNGAGKSGYVRTLKQFCRARGERDRLYPNIYEETAGVAEASLRYTVNGAEDTANWQPSMVPPTVLSEVSIFDSKAASVYVTQDNDVAYLPHGMDLFPRLVTVSDQVKHRLESELSQLDARQDRFDAIDPDTKVGQVLANLHVKDARQRVEQLGTVIDEDHVELALLREREQRMRSADPAARAKERRLCAERLASAQRRLVALETELADVVVTRVREAHEGLATARAAAHLAASVAFSEALVPGTGSEAWRVLWDAARRFVETTSEAGMIFPPKTSGAQCVLCQQEMTDKAITRMGRLEEFVKGETGAAVDRAVAELERHIAPLRRIKTADLAEKTFLDEVASLDEELKVILEECVPELESRLTGILGAEAAEDWDNLPTVKTFGRDGLARLHARVLQEAEDFDAASDPEALRTVEAARRELEARVLLGGMLDRVYAEIARIERRDVLARCIASATTTTITRKNTEMLAKAVTEPLMAEFDKQLAALKLSRIPLSLDRAGGVKGKALHGLSIRQKQSKPVPTDEVLSEGEHRCTALAAFFAEVALQTGQSTLVFDDPVSSLDHGRRQYIASRIIAIAASRPVIVFTHDLVFLYTLNRAADEQGVSIAPRYLVHEKSGAGKVYEDWPFQGLPVKKRIAALRTGAIRLSNLEETDRAAYERQVPDFYGDLRSSWERAVEECLLNGAITRFNQQIQTKRLAKLHAIEPQVLVDLENAMTRTSALMRGHDHAPELQVTVPEPGELKSDVDKLEAWTKGLNKLYN